MPLLLAQSVNAYQRDLPLSQVDNGSVSFVSPNLSAHVELRKLDLEKL